MAHTLNALKRLRQAEKRKRRNRHYKTLVKTMIKKFLTAITNKDKETAEKLFAQTQSLLDKCTAKGIIHCRTAARKKSKLNKKLNLLKATV